jgi:DNA-binding MurR/RpiR family transcriptional regulator
MKYCKEKGIPIVTFTNELLNSAAQTADIILRVPDPEKLDDRNMSPNFFFAEILMLFEYLMRSYCAPLK